MAFAFPLLLLFVGMLVMSWPFRLIILATFGATVAYVIYIQSLGGPDQLASEQDQIAVFKNYWSLLSVNIGLFLVATWLGLVRRLSSTDAFYRQRRLRFFLFVAKWGAVYFAFSILARYLMRKSGADDLEAWVLVRSFGMYGFAVCLIVFYLLKSQTLRQVSK